MLLTRSLSFVQSVYLIPPWMICADYHHTPAPCACGRLPLPPYFRPLAIFINALRTVKNRTFDTDIQTRPEHSPLSYRRTDVARRLSGTEAVISSGQRRDTSGFLCSTNKIGEPSEGRDRRTECLWEDDVSVRPESTFFAGPGQHSLSDSTLSAFVPPSPSPALPGPPSYQSRLRSQYVPEESED
jgi:hypothetical protein